MLPYLEYTTPDDILLTTVGSSSSSMAMLPNMIMSIVTYVSPIHQAYLRSAGLKGLLIFNELAEDGAVPFCVEAKHKPVPTKVDANPSTDDNIHHPTHPPQLIPFAIPPAYDETSKCGVYNNIFRFSTVVISHSAMVARELDGQELLLGYTVPLLRYYCDVSAKEVGSTNPDEPDHAFSFFDDKTTDIKEVQLTGCESVTTIHHSFLGCLSEVRRVDISPLQHVTSIGNYFMYQCDSLNDNDNGLDFTPFGKVTLIGDYFLQHCSAKTIDISPMRRLLHVGTGFLSGCNNLQEICTAPLANLQLIPADFLLGCKSLTSIDTTPFRNVTAIGGFFMGECPLLTTINLKPFENVTTIGVKFLYRCSGLKSMDVSLLKSVTNVGRDFLKGCTILHRGSRDAYCSVKKLSADSGEITFSASGNGQLSLKSALQKWKDDAEIRVPVTDCGQEEGGGRVIYQSDSYPHNVAAMFSNEEDDDDESHSSTTN